MTEYIREIVERLKSIQDSTERRASVDQGDTTVNLTRATTDTAGTEDTVSRTVGDGTFRYRSDSYRHTQYRHPIQAFFDVAITGTNSPVAEGDTLTVDYSVENTGNADGTQTITLEIDSTQEDSESQTLTFKTATSSTLQWATQSGDAGTFTATVASDDDSDSTTVTVGSTATTPASVIHQYRAENFASPWPDDVGSADMSITNLSSSTFGNGEDSVASDGVELYLLLSDDNDNTLAVETDNSYTDGNVHLVVINKTGNSAGDINIYVDDMSSTVSTTVRTNQAFDHTNYSPSTDFGFHARRGGGTTDQYKALDSGIFEFNTDTYSQSERDDLKKRRPEV